MTDTVKARIKNLSPGPRFFQASGADVTLQPGQTSAVLAFTEAEARNVSARVQAGELQVLAERATGRAAPVPTAGEGSAFAGKPLAEGADVNAASNPPQETQADRAADAATDLTDDADSAGFFTPGASDGPEQEQEQEREQDPADEKDEDPVPDAVSHAGGGWYYGLHNGERITEPMKKDAAEAYAAEHGVNIVS